MAWATSARWPASRSWKAKASCSNDSPISTCSISSSNTKNPDEIIKACQLLEPTFGGINLEDIKAPECFYIEETLKKTMKIPVFHDDQHGTAIISGAALLNARGADRQEAWTRSRSSSTARALPALPAPSITSALGVKRENITMVDTKGVVYKGRKEGMNPYKERFAQETKMRTLADAVKGADVLLGLSVKGAFTPEMIASMAPRSDGVCYGES